MLLSKIPGDLTVGGLRSKKDILCGAGYAWTPGLRVFDNSKR